MYLKLKERSDTRSIKNERELKCVEETVEDEMR